MSTNVIVGNTVIFRNPFNDQNIILKHDDTDYDLIFSSDVRFNSNSTHSNLIIGNFKISTTTDGSTLTITKNDTVLFSVSE